jgi:branched-chain amino acid aminotransferase
MIWIGEGNLGSLVPRDEALVSALDHGFTVGDGVFETLKVINGTAFAITRHLDRLERSASVLGLLTPDREVIRDAVGEVLLANAEAIEGAARLRITLTGGIAPLGTDRGNAQPTVVVAVMASTGWAETASIVTVPWVRNERSAIFGAKTISYAENLVALAYAHERSASEAVFANTVGELCEGTGSNIFVVVDGVAMTPPLSSGALPGITRELVLEWTEACEEDLDYDILQSADEIFLTSSTRDVHPVSRVDSREIALGPVTARIRDIFRLKSSVDLDP